MSDALRVIVVDDHPLFRGGVVGSLSETADIVVAGEASDAGGALRLAQQHLPDVALLDVNMPGGGIRAYFSGATATYLISPSRH